MADMLLSEIFDKKIDRAIDGVIRAADDAHLSTEIDEYVLTNEGEKHLTRILEAYTDYQTANGVWLSGFFGSGKSHMLKMLAHLLGDVQTHASHRSDVVKSFEAKTDDHFLSGLVAKAAAIPATNILFNIAEHASDKGQGDAILRAFYRMFNEARGYEGKLPYIARFERDLDREGQFEDFKAAFLEISGKEWESTRDAAIYADQYAGKAFAMVNRTDEAPEKVLARYRSMPTLTIDDFTDDVDSWLQTQGATHRLGFFVDEIGQFVGGNIGLMLELQTIAESLNTKCKGRAWVFVTSQEDMERVVGLQSKEQANDFSKIRDRFRTRVNLTSYDVAEVIRRRLLAKKRDIEPQLEQIYDAEKANFKAFFVFDGGKSYKNYDTSERFIDTYPFIDYQFDLFHQAMIGLSDHNAFEGRHASVGARSMLAATQQVASSIAARRMGSLATFDRFYDGLEADIKASAKGQIEQAKKLLSDELSVRVLKCLFLVKFVDGYTGTIRNLSILLFDAFNRSIPQLKDNIKSALDALETGNYIRRNGEVYEYLTNDEQVMESEIRGVNVDAGDVVSSIYRLLSQDVVKTSKMVSKKSGQDFPFGWMIDDAAHGPQRDLTLHIITPLNQADRNALRMQSAGKYELRVILDADRQLIPDLTLFLKTERYVKQKNSPTLSAAESAMLQIRSQFNLARGKEIVERLKKAFGASDLVVNSQDVPSSSQDVAAHLDDGAQALIPHVYPSLNILGDVHYLESDVAKFAVGDGDKLIGDDGSSKLEPVALEVLARVQQVKKQGAQNTVRTLVDHFEARPFGWTMAATLCATARLLSTSRLQASLDGNVIKKSALESTLRNTHSQNKTVLTPPWIVDPQKVQRLRTFCAEYFNEGNAPLDPTELGQHVQQRLATELEKLKSMRRASDYPFLGGLDTPIGLLESCAHQSSDWYFDSFADLAVELVEARENTIAPIEQFINGSQRAIYDDARRLVRDQGANLGSVSEDLLAPVRGGLDHPDIFRGKRLTHLKADTAALEDAIAHALDKAKSRARSALADRVNLIVQMSDYSAAEAALQERVQQIVRDAEAKINGGTMIPAVQQAIPTFDATTMPRIVDLLAPTEADDPPVKPTVALSRIPINPGLILIDSEDSLNQYVSAVREVLTSVLSEGKRITL
ncbi:BREX system P-loop protein BrxC (plasmid) [Coraliomargarita sp. W4R53]